MRRSTGAVLLAVVAVGALSACAAPVESHAPTPPSMTHPPASARPSTSPSEYVWWPTGPAGPAAPMSSVVRPRRDLTPGATNPAVTQATIATTICKRGWTATVRPPLSYTEPLKKQQIAQYGYADTNPAHYEEDHLVPLELGGAPRDPKNLWPEPGASPNPKDSDENRLHADVCAGRKTLDQARAQLLAKWGPQ